MVTWNIDRFARELEPSSSSPSGADPARRLGPDQRRDLSLRALAGTEPITRLAAGRRVSRKFVYQQAAKASEALDDAFAPAARGDELLFFLPVTKDWINQFVLAQVLIGHSSFRGTMEILDAVFDYRHISPGSIHNIVQGAVERARRINHLQDLCRIRVGAHDEIYQAGKPVLVGADVESTYCYLLACEDHCDETSWGVHLLELSERGLCPDYTIGDGGRGLRAGQAAAWEHTPCHGDVFHAERDFGRLAYYLENRASGCISAREKLQRRMQRAKKRGRGSTLSKKLALARQAQEKATRLAGDIALLAEWMQSDILSSAGPQLATRRELFDFVLQELRQREPLCPHRIGPVRRVLENHRDDLLAFVGVLEQKLSDIAAHFGLPAFLVHTVCELHGLDKNKPAYWQRQADLRKKLGEKFHHVDAAVGAALAETPRASSIVENLNSRLRNYFFLRRHIGNDYLDLLRFFLNHRCFLRSDRPERVGKSPTELLTGKRHPHWLELLGFERFGLN
jgi:hypothetical protein